MARRNVQLLTRPGCGLCDVALRRLRRLERWLPVEVHEVDIASDPALEAEYHLRIPVILDRHGRVVAEGEIGMATTIRAMVLAVV